MPAYPKVSFPSFFTFLFSFPFLNASCSSSVPIFIYFIWKGGEEEASPVCWSYFCSNEGSLFSLCCVDCSFPSLLKKKRRKLPEQEHGVICSVGLHLDFLRKKGNFLRSVKCSCSEYLKWKKASVNIPSKRWVTSRHFPNQWTSCVLHLPVTVAAVLGMRLGPVVCQKRTRGCWSTAF